ACGPAYAIPAADPHVPPSSSWAGRSLPAAEPTDSPTADGRELPGALAQPVVEERRRFESLCFERIEIPPHPRRTPLPIWGARRAARAPIWTSAEEGVEPRLHPLVREHRPLERAPHERLLLTRAREGREGGLGVAAVLLLGLDVDEVELHRVTRDGVVAERLDDHLGAVRTAGHLELHAEAEGAEALLEGGAAEVPDGRGRADGRGEGVGVAAVLPLGLDVDEVELHRVTGEGVVAERLDDHLGAVRTAGHLELHAEAEGAEALLEGGAAEVPDGRGRADGRGEGEMV